MTGLDDSLRQHVLWFTIERTSVASRKCRAYTLASEAGTVCLRACAFVWGRDISATDAAGRELMTVRRRRTFPLTGKVDVLEAGGRRIAQLGRNGRFRDVSGRELGRFDDARSLRDRARESAVQAVFEALLSDDSGTTSSGPTAFILSRAGTPAGSLVHARLPSSDTDPAAATGDRASVLRRLLPARLRNRAGEALKAITAPRGWKLERAVPPAGDPRVEIAAALLAIELSHW